MVEFVNWMYCSGGCCKYAFELDWMSLTNV